MHFEGKVAIVTGAASGNGLAVAQRLAREGARLMIADWNEEGLNTAAISIGGGVLTQQLDVSDAGTCAKLIRRTVQVEGQLDILCNVAGVMEFSPISDIMPERWRRMMNTNAGSVFYCRARHCHTCRSDAAVS